MRLLLSLLALALPTLADTRLVRETEALSPADEQTRLHVPDGFEIQLFASEPMINKPINMAFDARGRLWVSSTVEYPYSADKTRWSDPQGTHVKDSRDAIKILEDTDGDGRADKVTDFADGLNIPTGVLPWHKPEHHAGCIAWSIPNIWYFADTDGDGKADLREILFGPLGYEKDTHGMCSSFRLGLDGWVYATHGFNNTSTFSVAKDRSVGSDQSVRSPTLELHSGNVFRFRPDGSAVELWSAGQVNPFGLAWDRYNNLYSADCHSSPVYQLLRGAHYPSFGKPHDGLGFAPVMCQHTHGSTGICGIVYIDGGVWGPEWDDHLFLGNVVTSKINHDHVTFSGSTPTANEQPDFLTSDDPWFRPVDLTLGPDHALYIADFYNRIIGHYEVPLDHPGRDRERGRIWRVVKTGIPVPPSVSSNPSSSLGDTNLTRRLLAQSSLQRDHSSAMALAKSVLTNPPIQNELQTLDALWLLLAINQTDEAIKHLKTIARAIDTTDQGDLLKIGMLHMIASLDKWPFHSDDDFAAGFSYSLEGLGSPRAHQAALMALTVHPQTGHHPLTQLLGPFDRHWALSYDPGDLTLVHTAKLAVRSLLIKNGYSAISSAYTSGAFDGQIRKISLAVPTPAAASYLSLCIQESGEIKTQELSHIARHGEASLVMETIKETRGFPSADDTSHVSLIFEIHNALLERGLPPPAELLTWAQATATALLEKTTTQPEPTWTLLPSATKTPAWSLAQRKRPDGTELPTLQSMTKGGGDEESRTGTVRSKAFPAPESLLFHLCGHRGPPQAEAHDRNLVRLIAAADGNVLRTAFPPRSDTLQLVSWDLTDLAGQNVHLEIVDGDSGKAYAWLGIAGIEPCLFDIQSFQHDQTTYQSLTTLATLLRTTAPIALRDQLAPYLPPSPAPLSAPVSPEQRAALNQLIADRIAAFEKANPDLEVGSNVFKMNCAACHQIAGEGGLIGPQLDGIGTRGVARLCEDILDPNRNVDAHFQLHLITRSDGSTISGFLKAEVGQVLILADAAGTETRVPKADITQNTILPQSLMPPTFGSSIAEPDFTDLIGYLLTR